MGRDARCEARVGAQAAEVNALLESTELILRGAIKRRYPIAGLQQVDVVAGELCFQSQREVVALALGEAESRRWAAKIATPPPSLAAKLGVGAQFRAWVLGTVDDAALQEALHGACVFDPADAQVLVSVVRSEADLIATCDAHRGMACPAVWVVHVKGRAAVPGEAVIRQTLRARGYIDNKTSAVSGTFTATRYVRR